MTNNRIIPITDHAGTQLLPEDERYEPMPGSIVLTEGLHGTAWQRFFSDGMWHPTRGGRPRTWDDLLTRNNLVLIYDAEERAEANTRTRAQAAQWAPCTDTGCAFHGEAHHPHKHAKIADIEVVS